MTNLKRNRIMAGKKLREVAIIVKTTPQNIHRMENIGIHKPSTAKKYAVAFPGKSWMDLID